MLQKFIGYIKRIWNLFFGLEERVAPSVPTKEKIPPIPIVEPELDLAASVPPEYRQRASLFTYRERVFFKALLKDMGGQYVIFAKVRMGDIIWLSNLPENRKYHNNQILCKHFDFLLCQKESFKPLLAIELDDSSHDKYANYERDEFKEKVCAEIGLKLWRMRVQQTYPKGFLEEAIRKQI